MSGEPETLVLVYLRRLDAKMDRVIEAIQDPKHRVTSLEMSMTRVSADISDIRSDYAGLQVRMDRIETRLDRIEPRLDLQAAHS